MSLPLLSVAAVAERSTLETNTFLITLQIENVSSSTLARVSQVSTLSPSWSCHWLDLPKSYVSVLSFKISNGQINSDHIAPQQTCVQLLGVSQWGEADDHEITIDHVREGMQEVTQGKPVESRHQTTLRLILCRRTQVRIPVVY